ncbi:MAG: phage holin family protein [Chitinophagaceae bacterium]
MKFIVKILLTAIVVYALSKLLEPHIMIRAFSTAIVFALVLAVLNFIVKPLLVILTIPLTIITLGLFLLVINMLIVLLADKFVSGIHIENYTWAFIFSLILSVFTMILNRLKKKWSF